MSRDSRKHKLLALLASPPSGFWARLKARKAVNRLALYDSADVVEPLVRLLLGHDPDLAFRAGAALKLMNSIQVKQELARIYLVERKQKLLRIIREGMLVPDEPVDLALPLLLKLDRGQEALNRGIEIVEPLIRSLDDSDEEVAANARRLFPKLDQDVVRTIGERYLAERDENLGRIIAAFSLLPDGPPAVRTMLALKLDMVDQLAGIDPAGLDVVIAALSDQDTGIAVAGGHVLNRLTEQATIDALCHRYLETRNHKLAEIIVANRYQPETDYQARILIRLKLGMVAIIAREGAEVVDVLLAARRDEDGEIRAYAAKVLRSLKSQEAINKLVDRFLAERDEDLAQIIIDSGYRADQPPAAKIFGALLRGDYATVLNVGLDGLDLLIEALRDPDQRIRAGADFTFAALSRKDMTEEICRRIIHGANGRLREVAVTNGLRPVEKTLRTLFLFFTDQVDELLTIPGHMEHLAQVLKESEPQVREHLTQKIRATADPRFMALLKG
ncbi:hypothetical protein JW905_13445 [bacterium]|nr:hypothetical protein [candidate division CSSED10-310 bacterium]